MLTKRFYRQDALDLAPALLGCELVHIAQEGTMAGIIVETEAYRQDDEASHAFGGQTNRNAMMFGPGGYAYVYFTYGMHYCLNVVTGRAGFAEAVLIRALQPTQGLELMGRRRRTTDPLQLCSGPAKLVQALGVTAAHNGASLTQPQFYVRPQPLAADPAPPIRRGPRIGIRQATSKPWRFWIADNPYVTKHKFNNSAVPFDA